MRCCCFRAANLNINKYKSWSAVRFGEIKQDFAAQNVSFVHFYSCHKTLRKHMQPQEEPWCMSPCEWIFSFPGIAAGLEPLTSGFGVSSHTHWTIRWCLNSIRDTMHWCFLFPSTKKVLHQSKTQWDYCCSMIIDEEKSDWKKTSTCLKKNDISKKSRISNLWVNTVCMTV